MKIVVAGGGYAGLACLMELRRRIPDASLRLYDPRQAHLKLTHLHETVRHPLSRYQVPYAELGARLGFEHVAETVSFESGVVTAGDGELDYDYLVVGTGAAPIALPGGDHVYDRDALCHNEAHALLDALIGDTSRPRAVTVIGGGASGIQFLFEIADRPDVRRAGLTLRLVDSEARPLGAQPAAVGEYVVSKMDRAGITYLPNARYTGTAGDIVQVDAGAAGSELESGLTLMLAGVEPSPRPFEADRFGRLSGFDNAFAAGDCARFDSRGDDSMTAQVAVRQGKHVARNIDRISRDVEPLEYFFNELGYVVSLGPADAAGWLLVRDKVVTGLGAFAVKQVVEAQYDLFVAGIDTYLV